MYIYICTHTCNMYMHEVCKMLQSTCKCAYLPANVAIYLHTYIPIHIQCTNAYLHTHVSI